jgi:hypothetical protein
LAEGHNSLEAIIQSILIGRAEQLPAGWRSMTGDAPTQEELELIDTVETAVSEVMSLSQVQPAAVPIKEFCSRPENINLTGVCR